MFQDEHGQVGRESDENLLGIDGSGVEQDPEFEKELQNAMTDDRFARQKTLPLSLKRSETENQLGGAHQQSAKDVKVQVRGKKG